SQDSTCSKPAPISNRNLFGVCIFSPTENAVDRVLQSLEIERLVEKSVGIDKRHVVKAGRHEDDLQVGAFAKGLPNQVRPGAGSEVDVAQHDAQRWRLSDKIQRPFNRCFYGGITQPLERNDQELAHQFVVINDQNDRRLFKRWYILLVHL